MSGTDSISRILVPVTRTESSYLVAFEFNVRRISLPKFKNILVKVQAGRRAEVCCGMDATSGADAGGTQCLR